MSSEVNNAKIAKNTLFLYIRTFITLIVALYTSRVILEVLGITDYGIYNAVGGFVAMFTIVSSTLAAAISRFMMFEMGENDDGRNLQQIFSSSLIIQFFIALIIIIICETFGLWFLNNKMTIPEDRMTAAVWVFQFSVVAFSLNVISIPYNSCIIAHEHMKAFAYIGISRSFALLGVAFLIKISPIDQLIFYALLILIVAIFERLLYGIYCKRNFDESRFTWKFDRELAKKMFSFAGWNFFGSGSAVLRDQGVNVLINVFCGPAINAARGVAMQVSGAISSFSNNFLTAINPQLTKAYASGNLKDTFTLTFRGAKFSFYLLLLVVIPCIAEAEVLLQIWLKEVPPHSVLFVRLILIYVLTESISYTLITLMLATGDIKKYQIIVGGCQLMNFPLSWILLNYDVAPESTVIVSIIVAFCCLALRLYMLRGMVGLPVREFISTVLVKIIIVSIVAMIIPFFITLFFEAGISRFLIDVPITVLWTGLVVWYLGINPSERTMILAKAKGIIQEKIHR